MRYGFSARVGGGSGGVLGGDMSRFTADTGIWETPWNGVGHCIVR